MHGETVYISGPITGRPEAEYRAHFNAARDYVGSCGGKPVCPVHDVDHDGHLFDFDPNEWRRYMRPDVIAMLAQCTAVYALRGWQKSQGANLEVRLAFELGLTIYYEA